MQMSSVPYENALLQVQLSEVRRQVVPDKRSSWILCHGSWFVAGSLHCITVHDHLFFVVSFLSKLSVFFLNVLLLQSKVRNFLRYFFHFSSKLMHYCINYCRCGLCALSKVLLVERKLADVHEVLGQAGNAIEQWAAPSVHQKESLKVFFLVLQVCHYLMCGQVLALCFALLHIGNRGWPKMGFRYLAEK